MTTGAKPEFGQFLIEVDGQPTAIGHVEVDDGRQVDFLWKRGNELYAICLSDDFESGGYVLIKALSSANQQPEKITLEPGEGKHWHDNDLLIFHRLAKMD